MPTINTSPRTTDFYRTSQSHPWEAQMTSQCIARSPYPQPFTQTRSVPSIYKATQSEYSLLPSHQHATLGRHIRPSPTPLMSPFTRWGQSQPLYSRMLLSLRLQQVFCLQAQTIDVRIQNSRNGNVFADAVFPHSWSIYAWQPLSRSCRVSHICAVTIATPPLDLEVPPPMSPSKRMSAHT